MAKKEIKLTGHKKEMTQIFASDGIVTPVTEVVLTTELPEDIIEGISLAVTGTTKGRGFTGAMKRWNFKGGPATHGAGWHRKPGSAGAGTTPGRVLKGKHSPGHYGMEQVTIRGLSLVKISEDRKSVMVKGAIPGHRGSAIEIRITEK